MGISAYHKLGICAYSKITIILVDLLWTIYRIGSSMEGNRDTAVRTFVAAGNFGSHLLKEGEFRVQWWEPMAVNLENDYRLSLKTIETGENS